MTTKTDREPRDSRERSERGKRGERSEHSDGSEREPAPGNLSASEEEQVEQRTATRATVVHEAIRKEGEDELKRSSSALAWSGLAAGLSMGFSLVGEGLLREHVPDVMWRPLIAKFGYSFGFLIVVLGRQQLFTENTLTVILPLLHRRNWTCVQGVARLWGIVLLANLVGALAFAWVVGNTSVFESETRRVFADIGREALSPAFGTLLLRGIFAGWLIALMVWLLPVAETARPIIIILITYLVGLGGFSHSIAGSVEVLVLVTTGAASWSAFLGSFLAPTLIGNIVGGVSLVAALNHAQVVAGDNGNDETNEDAPSDHEDV